MQYLLQFPKHSHQVASSFKDFWNLYDISVTNHTASLHLQFSTWAQTQHKLHWKLWQKLPKKLACVNHPLNKSLWNYYLRQCCRGFTSTLSILPWKALLKEKALNHFTDWSRLWALTVNRKMGTQWWSGKITSTSDINNPYPPKISRPANACPIICPPEY